MRIIGDSSLDESRDKILGMRASPSGGWAPQSRRLYAGMAITQYIRRPINLPSGVVGMGRGAIYFQHEKNCVKRISHKFWRRVYPECIWVEHFY